MGGRGRAGLSQSRESKWGLVLPECKPSGSGQGSAQLNKTYTWGRWVVAMEVGELCITGSVQAMTEQQLGRGCFRDHVYTGKGLRGLDGGEGLVSWVPKFFLG